MWREEAHPFIQKALSKIHKPKMSLPSMKSSFYTLCAMMCTYPYRHMYLFIVDLLAVYMRDLIIASGFRGSLVFMERYDGS